MSTMMYDLLPDQEWDGWRLQKSGSQRAESIFLSKEMAMRLLPEATEGGCTVLIRDMQGRVESSVILD
ncbi:DUF2188 domain-containing protein [Sphingorhabdus contaminans]|uniref:DUF2188 domain-containing protein n=1 Tax=Sphingorhabdus contaminans TaxID=1343899 RepID=A0A553WK47_9SPHN|nr:DUF2188 domain-containing protein [Sphingorhabdus contaminans]TSB05038.1 DUF2188 domain-containing protein [Sphingorhabdus contaminans]